jgi:branched-chain amino acid transport system substrate-binding protein
MFEVAIDILKRAKSIEAKPILDAMVSTNYQSIVGPVQWTGKPVKNVTKTPLVAGQWKRKGDKAELVIVANKPAPNIPTGGKLELLS